MATRRTTKGLASSPSTPKPNSKMAPAHTAPTHSSFLPTLTESALLLVYPMTLLLGSLFSHLSPLTHPPFTTSTYSTYHQSYQPPDEAPSYFATKRNVFNVYFVKRGWGWTTVALLLFAFAASRGRATVAVGMPRSLTAPRLSAMDHTDARSEKDSRIRRTWQIVMRWALGTLAWMLVTQWFVGASLIDRVFRASGGACVRGLQDLASDQGSGGQDREIVKEALTSAACRVAGGRWSGGYDVSGHVFLLVLGSGQVAFEVLPVILAGIRGLTAQRVVRTPAGGEARLGETAEMPADVRMALEAAATARGEGAGEVRHSYNTRSSAGSLNNGNKNEQHGPLTKVRTYATTLALSVGVLSWWMLLMTAAFFHTWLEKATALVLAGAALWAIYYLPRGVLLLRGWIGMPGV